MNAVVTASPGAPAGTDAQAADAPALLNPFIRAAREFRQKFHNKTHGDFGASAIQEGPVDVAAFGFARSLLVRVTASGGAGGNAVAADDTPWNALSNITVQDVNGRPLFGTMDGFDLYLANLLGGYRFETDPTNLPGNSDMDSSGNFVTWLRIPFEITSRDGLGSLPNMTAASTYKVSYTVAPTSAVYGTVPTTVPDIKVEMWLEAWTQPGDVDARGVGNTKFPPAMGTSQFWTKQTHNITAGEQRIRLTRVGNLVRNIILVFRNDASPSVRITSELPTDIRFEFDTRQLDVIDIDVLRNQTREHMGVNPPTGVVCWDFTHDSGGKSGNEARHLYLPTTQATRLEVVGTFGGAGVLTVLTNDIAPVLQAA